MSQPTPSLPATALRELGTPLAAGLAVRLVWIALCPNQPSSDQVIYHDSARWLAEGLGYVDASGHPAGYWPVGYAALLAPFYALFGAHPLVAFLVNLLLGGATIAATYALGKALFGSRAGQAAAWVMALLPTSILYTTCIASENAVLPGLVTALWLFFLPGAGPRRALLDAGAGVVLALSTYVRGTALPFVLMPLALSFRTPRLALSRVLLASACVLLLTLPWGLRNRQDFGAFSLTSINAGANLWMGNHAGTDGMAATLPPGLPDGLAERDALLKKRAVAFIRDNPLGFVKLAVKRSWVTLRSDTIAATWNRVGLEARLGKRSVSLAKGVCTLGYFGLIALALLGLFTRLKRRAAGAPDLYLGLGCALIALPFVVIVGGNRYQMPMQPLLACWAGAWLAGRKVLGRQSG